jgi:hypothetical protein
MNESGRRISTILLVLQSFVIHRIASTDTMAAFTSHHITSQEKRLIFSSKISIVSSSILQEVNIAIL